MRHLVESCTVPEYGFFNSRLFTVIDAIVLQVFCEVLPTCGMCHLCLMCVCECSCVHEAVFYLWLTASESACVAMSSSSTLFTYNCSFVCCK